MKDTSNIRIGILILVCFFSIVGCDAADPVAESEPAPAVIPTEAFALDVLAFGQEADATKHSHNPSHYIAAVSRVGVASVITGTLLAYPSALTAAVQQVEPELTEEGYVWAADSVINGRVHGVELLARLNRESVEWTMRVSGINDEDGEYLDNFVLYEARTGILSHEGTFDVFYPVDGQSQLVVDGSYAVENESGYVLTVAIPEEVEAIGGAVATFERDGAWDTLDLTDSLGGLHVIEWNNQSGNGSLTADGYNNGEKSCWDVSKQNTACPSL